MKLRDHLACAAVVLAGIAVVPALGQQNPRTNNPNNQQQLSPVAQAGRQLQDAQIALRKAEADLNAAKMKVKAEFLKKPEWAPVEADLKKAQQDMKAAEHAAYAAMEKKPDYQELVKQREEAAKITRKAQAGGSDDDKVSTADLDQADQTFMNAGIKMKQMQKQALADDAAYGDAKARYDAANAKLAQLDAAVDDSVKADPQFQQLQQQVATAQQQVAQAQQQVIQARLQMQQQRQTQSSQHNTSRSRRVGP